MKPNPRVKESHARNGPAAARRLATGDTVVRLAAFGFFAGVALSWKAWFPIDRAFPLVPLYGGAWFAGGDGGFPWLSLLISLQIIVAAALLVIWPAWQLAAIALAIAWPLAVAVDQMRLQPWAFHYWLLLLPAAIWGLSRWRVGEVWVWRIVTVTLYFWAGAHKLAPQFSVFYQNTLVAEWRASLEGIRLQALDAGVLAIPLVEMIAALLLLVPQLRRAAVIVIALSHLAILIWIGPLGKNFNVVVWPWNVFAPVVMAIVFWPQYRLSRKVEGDRDKAKKSRKKRGEARTSAQGAVPLVGWPVVVAVAVLCGIMPGASYFGWPKYLSFHLYSGQSERFLLAGKQEPAGEWERLRPFAVESPIWGPKSDAPPKSRTPWQVDFMWWSLAELGVPVPAEPRIFQKIALCLIDSAPKDWTDADFFLYRDTPNLRPLKSSYYLRGDFPRSQPLPDL